MLRHPTIDDIPAIFNLVKQWQYESPIYREDGCEITVLMTLNQCLGLDGFLIYEHEGKPIGLHIWTKERYFTRHPYGCMFLFYVHPEHRRGTVAQELLQAALEDCRDCLGFYATSTAAFDDSGLNARAFSIMLRRAGFTAQGEAMFLSMRGK